MKVVQINAVCGTGSTGRICTSIADVLDARGIENHILYSSGECGQPNTHKFAEKGYTKFQSLKSRVLGNYGFNSRWETKKILAHLDHIQPDIVHLHNIHGHDCHLEMLTDYLKKNHIKVFWTFHDCWAFTGYCTHFILEGCDKWQTGCGNCPQRARFSWLWDRSADNFRRKQEAFADLDLTIVTPSQWMADLIGKSFLKDKPVRVIHNGIDLNVFCPTSGRFRETHGIGPDTFLLLGVAAGWSNRKGMDVFCDLSQRLDRKKYRIVLVGTDESVERQLPPGIIPVRRTNTPRELAEIYSAADLFVNPTREDTYPTVNMEAIACGTPVLTFRTGGSPEIVTEETGCVVESNDVDAMEREIIRICSTKQYAAEAFMGRRKDFDKESCFSKYLELYLAVYGRE